MIVDLILIANLISNSFFHPFIDIKNFVFFIISLRLVFSIAESKIKNINE